MISIKQFPLHSSCLHWAPQPWHLFVQHSLHTVCRGIKYFQLLGNCTQLARMIGYFRWNAETTFRKKQTNRCREKSWKHPFLHLSWRYLLTSNFHGRIASILICIAGFAHPQPISSICDCICVHFSLQIDIFRPPFIFFSVLHTCFRHVTHQSTKV